MRIIRRDEVQRNDQTIKETVSSDAVADLEGIVEMRRIRDIRM